ncbi:MAG: RnfABCDGE type electron transport complex subunit G [Bacteroidales bacterium]|jgi:electron transport complex protein RnfG|nr:RnfABCDGE type electron transport complex subunit G [Bacteroidales bacterium]MDD4830336.1 RnfABCDGE type electron transport complex subunit G [Bacteroidales bacterium]
MAKLESSLKNMVLSLSVITFIASGLLASSYTLTKEPIAKAQKDKQSNAIKEVLPNKQAIVGEKVEIRLQGKEIPFVIYPSFLNEEFVGAAIQTYSNDGYSGKIEIMVGIDKEGTISNYTILTSNETPGLGSKASQWFKTSKNDQDIRGKNPGKVNFTVKKDGGDIDAITASTISSRAFLASIRDAFEAFKKYQEQNKSK